MSSLSDLPLGETPQVSVIIPTFNNGRYLPEALDSVFNQNYDRYEVIVIDDGSTDHTRHLLQVYADRIRYLYQQNAGSAAARNSGLELARGEFIVFLDADDLLLPGKLRQQAAYLDLHRYLGLVHSGWQIIDEAGTILGECQPWLNAPVLDLETWLRRKPVRLGAMMFRHVWLKSVGEFDPELRQSHDVDLLLRLALSGCQAGWIYRPTMAYRVHQQSTIRRNALVHGNYVMTVLDKFFAHPRLPEELRSRESISRFFALTWLGWHAFENGHLSDVSDFLQKAWQISPYSPTRTVWTWARQFMTWLNEAGRPLDDIKALWQQLHLAAVPKNAALPWTTMERLLNWWLSRQPNQRAWPFDDFYELWLVFKSVSQLDRTPPITEAMLMDWWVNVWWFVVHGDPHRATINLQAHFPGIPVETLLQAGRLSIIIEHRRTTPMQLREFWDAVVERKLVPHRNRYDRVALCLSLSGQLALENRWGRSMNSLAYAVRDSWQPKTWPLWLQFIRNALRLTSARSNGRGMSPSHDYA